MPRVSRRTHGERVLPCRRGPTRAASELPGDAIRGGTIAFDTLVSCCRPTIIYLPIATLFVDEHTHPHMHSGHQNCNRPRIVVTDRILMRARTAPGEIIVICRCWQGEAVRVASVAFQVPLWKWSRE